NGDGFVDILQSKEPHAAGAYEQTCDANLFLNGRTPQSGTTANGGTFGGAIAITRPRRPWKNEPSGPATGSSGEVCSLDYQMDRRTTSVDPDLACHSVSSNYTSYRLLDLTGDGIPELVTETDFKPGTYDPVDDTSTDLMVTAPPYSGVLPCRSSTADYAACI